jgi:hypothetical protein
MRFKAILAAVLCCLFFIGDISAGSTEMTKKRRKKRKKKEVAFKQGQIGGQVAAGFVVKTDYSKTDYGLYGDLTYKKTFPIYFRAEYGITDFLGAGLYFGAFKEKVTITDVTNPNNIHIFDHSYKSLGVRFTYHQKLALTRLDPYAGIGVGLTMLKIDHSTSLNEDFIPPMTKAGIGYSVHAGANFYLAKNVGVFVEGGYAKWLPMVNAGISVKF